MPVVIVEMWEGRTVEQKRNLVRPLPRRWSSMPVRNQRLCMSLFMMFQKILWAKAGILSSDARYLQQKRSQKMSIDLTELAAAVIGGDERETETLRLLQKAGHLSGRSGCQLLQTMYYRDLRRKSLGQPLLERILFFARSHCRKQTVEFMPSF